MKNMRLKIFLLLIAASLIVSGCAKVIMGKVDLSDGKAPAFLQIGQTTPARVVSEIGEPLGYRERGNLAAMIYLNYYENYIFYFYGELRVEKAYRLDLMFENNVLIKAEVRKEGWGLNMSVNPQLFRLLGG